MVGLFPRIMIPDDWWPRERSGESREVDLVSGSLGILRRRCINLRMGFNAALV